MQYRSELWRAGLDYWKDLPFVQMLIGVGFRNSMGRLATWQTFHNFYVVLLDEAGLIGLVAFCSAVMAFTIRHVRSRNLARGRSPALVSVTAVLALCLHNMSEVFLYSPLFASLLMLFVCYGDVASPLQKAQMWLRRGPLRPR
jgi:O-antigen ligase